MKCGIYIFVVISLLLGLMGVFGCSAGKEIAGGNTPEVESLSMVVQMNGKELTVWPPTLSPGNVPAGAGLVTVVVKNSGHELITVAELEIVLYEGGDVEQKEILINELFPGDVQTLFWDSPLGLHEGSINVNVKRLE